MKIVKAGESHGEAIVGILTNVPAGIKIEKKQINALLKERSFALGRSVRQKMERDKVDMITGIRGGFTLGNNVAVVIKNSVHKHYEGVMNAFEQNSCAKMTALRPAHADLPGVCRCGVDDIRNVLEGASARNTCVDVALGAIAISMLEELGIKIAVCVKSLGAVKDENSYSFNDIKGNKAPAFSSNKVFIKDCKSAIENAIKEGESLGGVVEILVSPVKPGFGHYTNEKRVDALIAQLIMQIQAVKGVFFGENPFESTLCGSEYVGRIERSDCLTIADSKTGGIDGGMTNGDAIKITVAVKPIPTTVKGVKSVDLISGEDCISAKERADVTAVFAICPILKSIVALALSEAICERLGCDNMKQISKRYNDL